MSVQESLFPFVHKHVGCPVCWWYGALATFRRWLP